MDQHCCTAKLTTVREALDNIHNAKKKKKNDSARAYESDPAEEFLHAWLPNDAVQLEILHFLNTPSLAKVQRTHIVVLGFSALWEQLQS